MAVAAIILAAGESRRLGQPKQLLNNKGQTLLEREDEHPQTVVEERGDCRVVIMDSARWVDERNTGHDVVVPASYIGVLPARMVAMHRPRGVIGHDACIGKEGAGVAGLWYLEALGIPAATADGMSAEISIDTEHHRHLSDLF